MSNEASAEQVEAYRAKQSDFGHGYDAGYNAGYREARQAGRARMRDAWKMAEAFQQQARRWLSRALTAEAELAKLRADSAAARQTVPATPPAEVLTDTTAADEAFARLDPGTVGYALVRALREMRAVR